MAMLHHQELLIPSAFGRAMAADLTYAVGSRILAVYAHGINGFKDWGGMDLIANEFASQGIAFLKFNFSHNGTTPDDPLSFVDLEAYGQDNYSIRQSDLKSVFNLVHSGGLPLDINVVVLIGHSRGGVDATIYACQHDHLDALITWSAPSEANTPWSSWDEERLAEWKEQGVTYLVNGRTKQKMPLYYQLFKDVESNANRYDILERTKDLQIPWLIVHGDADEAVSTQHARKLARSTKYAQVQLVPKTGHTFDRTHPWEQPSLPNASIELCEHSIRFILDSVRSS